MRSSLQISFIPYDWKIEVNPRWSLRDAAIVAGIPLTGSCGGNGICGKCRIKLVSGEVDGEPDENGIYLACRTLPRADCVVEIPEESRVRTPKTILRGARPDYAVDPPALRGRTADDPLRVTALGVACDLGTSTIVVGLARLHDGEVIATDSIGNPQVVHGDDVVSRIAYASQTDGLTELRTMVLESLDGLISNVCNQAGVNRDDILDLTVAGNATMNHIFAGESPSSLGVAPYEPVFLEHDPIALSDIGLAAHPDASARILPNIAGYIGGDTTAGILSTGLHESDSLRMFIDIGTNGEIVLGNKDGLTACSAAAGPAFEGGRIERGMRAEPGAIERVIFKGGIRISTIDNVRTRGVCGTGVIQAVGCMLETGLIDKAGRIVGKAEAEHLPWNLGAHIHDDEKGRRIVLWEEDDEEVALGRKDISEIAIAKASIRAAAEILLKETNSTWDDVDEILFAGSFGNFLRASDAEKIGLIPKSGARVKFAGNTSLEGALKVLLSSDAWQEALGIARSTRFVELAGRGDFGEEFVNAIPFP